MFESAGGALPAAVIDTLNAVRDRMPLDYFGMDFGVLPDGQVVLFEANATMNFFPFLPDPRFAYVRACQKPAAQAFHEMLARASSIAATPEPARAT